MVLIEYPEPYAVVRFPSTSEVPPWAEQGRFSSITRTHNELSVICQESLVPITLRAERGMYMIGCEGPLDFSEVGILAQITSVLAGAGISVLAVATHDTDYLFTRNIEATRETLRMSGYEIRRESSSDTSD